MKYTDALWELFGMMFIVVLFVLTYTGIVDVWRSNKIKRNWRGGV